MTLDIDRYRVNVPFLIVQLARKETEEERMSVVNEFAVVTGVPVLACFYYYAEIYGLSPAIQRSIDSLTAFYRVTNVLGVRA